MITPSFGLTATERVLPKLALDFTTALLDPRITFTRSGNTATVVNSSGYITPINADLPRFDYDPVTLACRGLLIEEQRINVCLYSEDFRNTAEAGSSRPWAVSSGANTVTANAGTSPANDNTASQMSFTASSFAGRGQSFTATSGVTYTWSVWIKRLSGAGNGRISFVGAIASATSFAATGDWQRISITATAASTGTATALVFPEYLATRTGDYLLWGGQIEAGAFATSYIPNVATGTTTRNADVATMTGTNFSDWFNATEGAFSVQMQVNAVPTGNRYPIYITDGTATNIIAGRLNTSPNFGQYVFDTSVQQVSMSASNPVSVNTPFVGAFAYKQDSFAVARNATLSVDTLGTVPIVNQLAFQTANSSVHYQKLNYWPQRLTNAEVQAFSKG
jgi:hypothetical protein